MTTSAITPTFRLRCIQCGAARDSAGQDFRCPDCGDLLEVFFPAWANLAPDPATLKNFWRERKTSRNSLDQSGVWRFRELLPELTDWDTAITIREGNTPLYDLPRCARSAGVDNLLAKHQGMNPTGSFKDNGMTVAASFAKQAGFSWVACASTGNTSAHRAGAL